MAWGDKRLDRSNDPLYARLNLTRLFDGQSFGEIEGAINLPKIFRWCPNPRCRTERPYDFVGGASFHKEPGREEPGNPSGVYSLLHRCAPELRVPGS